MELEWIKIILSGLEKMRKYDHFFTLSPPPELYSEGEARVVISLPLLSFSFLIQITKDEDEN